MKPSQRRTTSRVFPIVGVGASAGGLEAFEQFLRNMPSNTGMAFVLVQHLDPTHKDIMAELLQRVTKMEVQQVKDATKVKPDCVYVIPPNKDMSILHGVLHLLEPFARRGLRLPIDFFLRHLADDQKERSIGIILSGMGTDGTLGLKAIKEKMGMTMVQDPASAKFGGMPGSAVDMGLADYIGRAEDLPAKLIAYVKHAAGAKERLASEEKPSSALEKVCILLRAQTGNDFFFYKKNMLYRRIERRMGIHQLEKIALYVRFLQENPQELELLFKELLIGVTNFFRDPEAFEILKRKALPFLQDDRMLDRTLRIWVPGCSTGEEAYSIAITLREMMDQATNRPGFKIQIFATDIDKDAIDKARHGAYPGNIVADVSPERLKRFFVKENGGYRTSKEIREMVIFAPQNIITDPPFTKLDIVSCRNLLIYLAPELQKKLLFLFHYCLKPQGILFLGPSETVGTSTDLFAVLDLKWKLYVRRESTAVMTSEAVFTVPLFSRETAEMEGKRRSEVARAGNLQELANRMLLEHFAPPAVLINDQGDILYFGGRTGKYLEPPAGKANLNVYAMAREGLQYELTSGVRRALASKEKVISRGLKIKTDLAHQVVDLTIEPLIEPSGLKGLLLVVFSDVAESTATKPSRSRKSDPQTPREERILELEEELQRAKENLQMTIEEVQTSQEELKSANEELQSMNEELQSTNEELNTSKEELQSLNEELLSVNTELQTKIDELTLSHNDMKNLLNSTDIATLFLDGDLNVRRFTPQATKIIKLINSDVGRPITDITTSLQYEALADDVKVVLETLLFKETQVTARDGRWYSVRIMPYRTSENVIDGTVITFLDITLLKQFELSLGEKEQPLTSLPSQEEPELES
jgi:chemotaxis methyl-accepting protein methylase/PAS domain-containing protein